MSQARPSTDNENAPLLVGDQERYGSNPSPSDDGQGGAFVDIVPSLRTRKLSVLEKILFCSTIAFLILTSIVGLNPSRESY